MYKHILLPTDGSDLSKAAMKHGIALAKAIGAKVTALVVSTPLNSLVVDPSIVSGALDQYKVWSPNRPRNTWTISPATRARRASIALRCASSTTSPMRRSSKPRRARAVTWS